MRSLNKFEVGLVALGLSFSANAQADEISLHEAFCNATKSYGARSWQALSYVDAKSHNGANYYVMSDDERSLKMDEQLRFVPDHLRGKMKENMSAQYRSFDVLSQQEKRVMLLSELSHHGVTLQNLKDWEQRCPE